MDSVHVSQEEELCSRKLQHSKPRAIVSHSCVLCIMLTWLGALSVTAAQRSTLMRRTLQNLTADTASCQQRRHRYSLADHLLKGGLNT